MYDPFAPRFHGKIVQSWLSVRDPSEHALIKRPIANAYSFSNITEYEPLVDNTINKLVYRLNHVSKPGSCGTLDLAVWLRLCK